MKFEWMGIHLTEFRSIALLSANLTHSIMVEFVQNLMDWIPIKWNELTGPFRPWVKFGPNQRTRTNTFRRIQIKLLFGRLVLAYGFYRWRHCKKIRKDKWGRVKQFSTYWKLRSPTLILHFQRILILAKFSCPRAVFCNVSYLSYLSNRHIEQIFKKMIQKL